MKIKKIESILEAVLFASGEPVPMKRIAKVLDISVDELHAIATNMKEYYENEDRGIRLLFLEDELQLCSAPQVAEFVGQVLETRKPAKLTQTQLEVLSVIAYYQPVTKAYIEKIRGVDSGYTVGLLLNKGLIEDCGRLAVPGRPVLYRTTSLFLRTFGISTLDELPALPESQEDSEEELKIKLAIDALQQKEDDTKCDVERQIETTENISIEE